MPNIKLGNHKQICGKTIRNIKTITSQRQNGQTPENISYNKTSFPATPFIGYTFNPTGGFIAAILVNFNAITPNQMGSL